MISGSVEVLAIEMDGSGYLGRNLMVQIGWGLRSKGKVGLGI